MNKKEYATFLIVGDLVYYIGPPILNPQDWARIVSHNNGLIDHEDIGIVLFADNFLKIANIYFQESEIQIPRLSYNHLFKIE